MHWEFTDDTPLTAHTLREILDTLPGDTPICLATTNNWDSEPVYEVDLELAVRVDPYWSYGTNDPVTEKTPILCFRS